MEFVSIARRLFGIFYIKFFNLDDNMMFSLKVAESTNDSVKRKIVYVYVNRSNCEYDSIHNYYHLYVGKVHS